MRGLSVTRTLLLATAAAALGWGQPTITTLQSSQVGSPASDVTGITSGTALQAGGFRLYINGSFLEGALASVTWLDTSTNVPTVFNAANTFISVAPTQIVVTIPNAQFQTLVASPVAVTITVQQSASSNAATFTINPPLRALGPILPGGTINTPYSVALATGGTAPFAVAVPNLGLPPGIAPGSPNDTLVGTPTQTGVFSFLPVVTDFWGNIVQGTDFIEIVVVPTLTSLSPNASPAGADTLTLTVNGNNFVGPATVGQPQLQIPGSQVQWKIGNVVTPLATTFVSSNQLTAIVPSTLLANAGAASVTVAQPGNVDNASSNALPFTVAPPSIAAIVPASVPAGSTAITLAVTGANFVVNASAGSQSTVSLNGVALTTTFVNTGTLTAVVPANLLISPTQYSVQVTNPGGAVSNTATFSVVAPAISSLSPTSVPAGSAAFGLTVTGANYLSGSQVSFRGTTLTATFVNSTTLTTTVPASLITASGQVNVQVINPGGTPSNIVTFTVAAPPTLSSISPTTVPAGSAAFTLAVSGTSFVSGSQVSFNGAALTTTFGSSTALSAAVPASAVTASGQVNVQVISPGGALSNTLPFNVVGPAISSLSPASVPAGSATFNLTVGGVNFVSGSQVSFGGSTLATSFVSSTALNASVPAALAAAPKTASIVVTNPGGSVSPAALFTVTQSLTIATTALPAGNAGSTYSATLTGRGGTPPYTWTASGLPPGLAVNSATGAVSGVLPAAGTFLITVVLQDAAKSTATAQFPLVVLVVGPPPVSIAASSNLPSSVVGAPYLGFVFANGGSAPYTFTLGGGRLPDGLTLSSDGTIFGTPKTAGQFSFTVVVTDSTGNTAAQSFGIGIQPPPLGIAGASGTLSAGTPVNITFAGTGGVAPYRFSIGGSLPPGTVFSSGGVLSGTPTTEGVFTFSVTITDSTGVVVTKSFTLTVGPAGALSLSGGSLNDAKAGVPYTGQISATGGTGPYTYSASGLPDGISLSASGSLSGTPATAGQFSFTVIATDSTGARTSGTFRITIAPADLTIVTATLPAGVANAPYSATLTASGGVPPYTWTVTGLPDGVTATAAGVISGTPTTAAKFSVIVSVKDAAGATIAQGVSYTVTIAPAPLGITTASAPNGTAGTAYAASFAASGGTAPFTFSATGLPAGLSMSAAGVLSGTPTAPGAATIVVTVNDAAGGSVSKSFPVTIGLPATPSLSLALTGISDTATPLQQPRLQVTLGNSFPVDVVVTLTLTFAPDSGADDPTIQFSGGGRTARITVPAGATNGATDIGVQIGTVAGVVAITAQMQASGQDVTPSPAPGRTIRIAAAAPVIVPGTLTAVRNSTGFTITLTGYVTDRELTQAVFQFTAAAGSSLQTTTLTVPIDVMFAQYFSGSGAIAFGSQFTYIQPFTVTGSTQAIGSVTVTLVNKIGQSAPATATLN